jgi:hypothetical protein
MSDEDNVIDAEVVSESDNLPAIIEPKGTHGRAAPIEGRDWSTYSRPERRCTAHSSRTGEQCKNVAIKGHNVCRFHGGAARQIKQAARTRLDNAADRMARELLGFALAGETEHLRLIAIRDALDRIGITKPTEVILSQGDGKPYEEVFDEIAGASRAESRRARGFLEPDAFDAPPTQGEPGLPTGPPTQAPPADQRSRPSGFTDYDEMRPEYVPRDDLSPTYQHRADPAGDDNASVSEPNAPAQSTRRTTSDRQRGTRRPHITGQAALSIAADLARQRAIESPHKRYLRP